ncbi:hypothetical protein [Bifidobacterium simiarum]|uniref:Uncharacterized protein n=1 Tax=Bifidobacterium simiarum TaxID=2045441 RepID=A0A2M9HFI9_9BIFI|nr:hypothetical protein [Bifidobacterium simiarum]PJM75579.1 hypothetical protein CSQ87_03925 [Bifidobacterium simiarum]
MIRSTFRNMFRHRPIEAATAATMATAATCAACAALMLSMTIASPAHAAMAGIAGQGGDDSELSACERALTVGYRDSARYRAPLPSSVRLLAASGARSAWSQAAVDCPGRFAEGTVRSAQAMIVGRSLEQAAGMVGRFITVPSDRIDDGEIGDGTTGGTTGKTKSAGSTGSAESALTAKTAAALAVAEDRAGFGFEVLAARHSANATMHTMSNRHKANAQLLATAVKQTKDPRQKVYAVKSLLAGPNTIIDPTNGIVAPTTAVVEMNCAMEQLNALAEQTEAGVSGSSGTANNGTNATSAKTTGDHAAGAGTSADSTTTSTSLNSTGDSDADATSTRTMIALSDLIAAHIVTAHDLGYPGAETLLLK